jgi:Putative threonine/serine exporter
VLRPLPVPWPPPPAVQLSDATALIVFCPCKVLLPAPHILNGAIDLAHLRISLGIARLTYAALIVLMICIGVLVGLNAGAQPSGLRSTPHPVPLLVDVIAAGSTVAAFGTFFSMPWRWVLLPIAVGMLAHAARWALISVAGVNVATGALVACILVSVIVSPVASTPRCSRVLCSRLDDAGLLPLQHRNWPRRVGLDWAERTSKSDNEHSCERYHRVPGHTGYDNRIDPPAHAVRALFSRCPHKLGQMTRQGGVKRFGAVGMFYPTTQRFKNSSAYAGKGKSMQSAELIQFDRRL